MHGAHATLDRPWGAVMLRSLSFAVLAASLALLPSAAFAKRHHASEDNAPPPPPALPPMVTLTPGPGISFQIPNNWIACEDDTEKQLASAPDSMNMKTPFCANSTAVASVVRAFDPRPFHTATLIFDYKHDSPLTEKAMADMQAADLAQLRGPICDSEMKPMHKRPNAKVDCDIALGTLAGHRAMISTIVETDPNDANATFRITSYEVVYPGGYIQLQIGTADVLEKLLRPAVDAILASVHFDDTVVPPGDAGQPPQSTPDNAPAKPAPTDGSI
jgi:hypothetical protein